VNEMFVNDIPKDEVSVDLMTCCQLPLIQSSIYIVQW